MAPLLRDVGCLEDLTSPVSSAVPAGISKSGALSLAAVARTLSAKPLLGPLPRSVVGRNGAAVRVFFRTGEVLHTSTSFAIWRAAEAMLERGMNIIAVTDRVCPAGGGERPG
jgi:hypothetical protein